MLNLHVVGEIKNEKRGRKRSHITKWERLRHWEGYRKQGVEGVWNTQRSMAKNLVESEVSCTLKTIVFKTF